MALDREICAATAFMEASNQGQEGRRAVIHVLLNRSALAPRYGSTPADCALRAFQFSCWNTSDTNRHRLATVVYSDPIWSDCLAAWDDAQNGDSVDPTNGATHYIADGITPPDWVSQATFTIKIGQHSFYKDVP